MQADAGPVAEGLGADVDHAAEAIAAETRRHRAAVNLDACDSAHRQTAQIDAATAGAIERHAVEKDLDLLGSGPADRQGAETAQAAVAANIDAGRAVERLRQIGARSTLRAELNGLDKGGGVRTRRGAAGAHHHFVHQQR